MLALVYLMFRQCILFRSIARDLISNQYYSSGKMKEFLIALIYSHYSHTWTVQKPKCGNSATGSAGGAVATSDNGRMEVQGWGSGVYRQ